MASYWYKNAIIYSLDIKTFMDSNGDGRGDFTGLIKSLDYLSGLGITCLWVQPFFPSPNKDNGYDVSDYYAIDPDLGNLGSFVEFIDKAKENGIRVLIDLVLNHTSDQHPWFREARQDRNSKYRNYYIWVDKKPRTSGTDTVFGKHQGGNWEYDEMAKAWYYHTFYKHQPDLNITNPDVIKEIRWIMRFWLKLGVAGFRMDAVPHMIRQKGNEKFEGDPHDFFRGLREFVEEQRKDAVLLAEVDTEPERYRDFLGKSDQMHMLFNFYLNNYLFLAFARGEAGPVIKALKALPPISGKEQLATFLRNHDELDLERLSDKEREEVFAAFAPEENMRIYGRGIRRRLPPMFGNDRRRIELAYSLLFSLPGTPVFRYGDEIGMGDDLSLKERNSVRTVMQWSAEKNGGFSTASAEELFLPAISGGEFGYERLNVHQQMRDPNSFLNWMERIIAARKECIEFGRGEYEIIPSGNPGILIHCCRWKSGLSLAIHNFTGEECDVTLDLKTPEEKDPVHLIDMFGDKVYEAFDPDSPTLHLSKFGYRWLRKSSLIL
ncbi:MAG TPA: alpha-amylase family protein [Anseongella sp.]|nr:alpha-amylase family protein [Anseongella sp.]